MARPKRTPEEQIEDQFCDLTLEKQATMLDSLARLHRWCTRERSRAPEQPAKSQQAAAANGADAEGAQA